MAISMKSRTQEPEPVPERHQELKQVLSDFVTDAVLPGEVARRVALAVPGGVNPVVMAQALKGAQERVAQVIQAIPRLSAEAFVLRLPGQEFLEFALFSEYIMVNSVAGEQASLRHLHPGEEPPQRTLARCLGSLGFHRPADLDPYEKLVREKMEQGEDIWQRLVASLEGRPTGE